MCWCVWCAPGNVAPVGGFGCAWPGLEMGGRCVVDMGGWASSVRPFSAPAGTIRIDKKNGVGVGGNGWV